MTRIHSERDLSAHIRSNITVTFTKRRPFPPHFPRRGPLSPAAMLLGSLLIAVAPVALGNPTAQWVTNLTVTSVSDNDYGGEVVQVTVSQGSVLGCTYTDAYEIRDINTTKGSLALLTAAFIAGRPVDLFVSGTCDSTGRPDVTAVQLDP